MIDQSTVTVAAPERTAARAALALARVEAVRFVRHPLTMVAVLLFVSPWLYDLAAGTGDRFPVLQEKAVNLQLLGLFALGGGALVTAHLAALRAHRHRAEELFGTLVLPAAWRTGAALLALLPYAAVVALLVAARLGAYALLPGAAGRPDPAEAAAVPAVVVLFGAVGVLLARVLRSAAAAPLALVLFAVVMFAGLLAGVDGHRWARNLLPIMVDDRGYAVPVALGDRPSGRHLAYVLGLILVVALAALARAGARRPLVALAVAVTLTAAAGATQFRGDPAVQRLRAGATLDPAALSTCRTLASVRYCAFDDFVAWIPAWDEVLRGVVRAAPAAPGPPLAVRQRVWADAPTGTPAASTADEVAARADAWRRADAAAGYPEAVMVGTQWGTDSRAATFAAAVAYRVLTGTTAGTERPLCGARGALLIWLVAQATPATARGLHELDDSSWGSVFFIDLSLLVTIAVDDRAAAPALALLSRPGADVAAVVRQHWGELTDPAAPVERFGTLFGVAVPPEPPIEERTVCAA